jgi:spermidine synthase
VLAIVDRQATPVPETLALGREARRAPRPGAWAIYVAIALSGATALSSEVIWTRLLSLLFGGTVYTFSLILAVFLFGSASAAASGSAIGRGAARPRARASAGARCSVRRDRVVGLHADAVDAVLAGEPVDHDGSLVQLPARFRALHVGRAAGAILWGASFPLALASLARRGQDPARLVGGVYAANTVGAIVGSLCASLLLVVWLGSQHAQQVLILLSALSGCSCSRRAATSRGKPQSRGTSRHRGGGRGRPAVAHRAADPGIFAAYGRYTATRVGLGRSDLHRVKGWNATVPGRRGCPAACSTTTTPARLQASSEPQDMRPAAHARPHDDAHPEARRR